MYRPFSPSPLGHSLRRTVTAALIALTCLLPARAGELSLPEIGDPSSIVLSRSQEAKLGKMLLAEIRGSLNVLRDPELNTYVQSLGTQILTGGAVGSMEYNFLLIDNPAINAFAAPGGIVAVHTGLLTTAESESELAAVISHEIAHVTQRHLARMYAKSSKLNIATALGILGAIVAGVAGGGEMGQAALYGTMAAGVQSQLAFSRGNEQEADRVGIRLLADAGFDPEGMPSFLNKLHEDSQLSRESPPEYVSTHPVTLTRISDTRNRAAQMEGDFVSDRPRFHYAKARAVALTSNPSEIINRYREHRRDGREAEPVDRYAYGIALSRAGSHDEAIEVLNAINDESGGMTLELALAQAYIARGDADKAAEMLTRLNEIYPHQEAVVYHLARALLDQGKSQAALDLLERQTRSVRHNPELDRLKAEAAADADQLWRSHESMSDYYAAHGHYGAAVRQMDLALDSASSDDYARALLQSRRKDLVRTAEEREAAGG